MTLIYDIKPPEKTITLEAPDTTNAGEYIFNPPVQRIIDLRPNIKDTEFNINDEDLKNGYIGYASWDSKISIPLRS